MYTVTQNPNKAREYLVKEYSSDKVTRISIVFDDNGNPFLKVRRYKYKNSYDERIIESSSLMELFRPILMDISCNDSLLYDLDNCAKEEYPEDDKI